MVKKVKVEQLKPGMFIEELNCSWLNHPFFGNSKRIDSDRDIEKIINYGINEVYIDTQKGLDIEDVTTIDEVDQNFLEKIEKITKEPVEVVQPVTLYEEIINAKKIKKETLKTVHKVMDDVMTGKKLERERVADLVDSITKSVFRNQGALMGLGKLRKVDEYLYNHSMSVCVLMTTFAKQLGIDTDTIREIGIGAMLHDIGTSKVPHEIVSKTSSLTDQEFEEIKKHVVYGREILENTKGISETSITAACQHHERLNGSGYPDGLKGSEISPLGQAMAIVDVYDALTTKRCYKRSITPTQALKILFEWEGDHFNGELVQQFIRCVGVYPVGSLVRLESGILAVVVNQGESDFLKPIVRAVYNTKRQSNIVIPYDIDLSMPESNAGEDRVIGYEQPEEWDLYPEVYL